MTRLPSVKLRLLFIGVGLLVSAGAPHSRTQAQGGPARGNACCDQIAGQGRGIATAADTFSVDATFSISGRLFGGVFGARTMEFKSTTRLLTQSPPTADGTINAITSHVLEAKGYSDEDGVCEPGEDCLITLDRAALIPTATPGLMKLRSILAFSGGQGRFEKACGKIDGTEGEGEINFAATPPTVRWTFNEGRLCYCP
ncbi:MAG: hypothetical protein HOP19_11580 [Acidobacteria bacterium]|nr:hypothetical protein [Acidobacteriota bacterium]